MRGGRSACGTGRSGFVFAAAAAVLTAAFLIIGYAPPAQALPSYARQTGQPCGTCHTDFAGLTPYGRLFKIQGYTAGGGPYRSTLFPGSDSGRSSYVPPLLAKSIAADNSISTNVTADPKPYVPPLSMMTVVGFTNTQAPLPQPSAPFNGNNNVALSSVNFMYGGAITEHIGAFAQVSYNGQPAGGFGGDPFGQSWTWDNTDIRYAEFDQSWRLQRNLRHYGKQQSDRPGPLEYDVRLGVPICFIAVRCRPWTHPNYRRCFCTACSQLRRLRVHQRYALPRNVDLQHTYS